MCGENPGGVASRQAVVGSPPRVWGKLDQFRKLVGFPRFTPTCVGKTSGSYPLLQVQVVHPHVCGENVNLENERLSFDGSPPRVWGKLELGNNYMEGHRFTPTCVGKTTLPISLGQHVAVHPHVCGENITTYLGADPFYGSPPRVWGKHQRFVKSHCVSRFTPTCVGKTFAFLKPIPPRVVHPHVCGENCPT